MDYWELSCSILWSLPENSPRLARQAALTILEDLPGILPPPTRDSCLLCEWCPWSHAAWQPGSQCSPRGPAVPIRHGQGLAHHASGGDCRIRGLHQPIIFFSRLRKGSGNPNIGKRPAAGPLLHAGPILCLLAKDPGRRKLGAGPPPSINMPDDFSEHFLG